VGSQKSPLRCASELSLSTWTQTDCTKYFCGAAVKDGQANLLQPFGLRLPRNCPTQPQLVDNRVSSALSSHVFPGALIDIPRRDSPCQPGNRNWMSMVWMARGGNTGIFAKS